MQTGLTPKLISAVLNVDSDTVINWSRRGVQVRQKNRTVRTVRLKAFKIGGRWFIAPESLLSFLRLSRNELPAEILHRLGLPSGR